jgi:hypothetical protein
MSLDDAGTLVREARIIEQASLGCCQKILRGFISSRSKSKNPDIRSRYLGDDDSAAPITLTFE